MPDELNQMQDTLAEMEQGNSNQEQANGQPSVEQLLQEIEELRKHNKRLNNENAQRRIALEKLGQEEQEKRAASMTELEKVRAELEQLKQQYKQAAAQIASYEREKAFQKAVAALQVKFVSDIAQMDAFNYLPDDLDINDDKAVKAALDEVKQQRPYLFAEPPKEPVNTDAGAKGGMKPGELTNERKAELLKRFNLRR